MWFTLFVALAWSQLRFVYRRRCSSEMETDDTDRIGCAERYAIPFEEMLTPPKLLCNETYCETTLGTRFDVYKFECTAQRCVVLVRCATQYTSVKRAVLFAALVIGALVLWLVLSNLAPRPGHDMNKML